MRLQRGPASVLPKLLGVNSRLFSGAQSLIVNLVPSFPLLSTLTTIIMKKTDLLGVTGYVTPELSYTEISVENGFAASSETENMSLDAPDYSEGVTL